METVLHRIIMLGTLAPAKQNPKLAFLQRENETLNEFPNKICKVSSASEQGRRAEMEDDLERFERGPLRHRTGDEERGPSRGGGN